MTDDDKTDRREFFERLVSDEKPSNTDHGWKPDWQPKTEQELQQNRREAREQLGDVKEPDEPPFDALDYLDGLAEDDKDENSPEQSDEQRRRNIVVHRPPRALEEPEFLDACTRCGDCVDACPHDAIELAGPRFRDAEGTPKIDPSRVPCYMCEDTPCVSACEPDALVDSASLSMGDAQIDKQLCLAHRGEFCTTCSERCPMPGAIKVRDGKPTIRTPACTGCGVCHHVCPAPINAVRIFPRGIPEAADAGNS